MNRITLVFAASLVLVACGGNQKKTTDQKSTDTSGTDKEKVFRSKFDTQKFLGEYIGSFGKSTLILDIDYVNGNNVSGFNIVKGNRRNIKGTLEDKGATFNFRLEEPGSDQYDGVFVFSVDTGSLQPNGTWTPNDTSKVKPQTFTLKKRSGQGQPEGFSGTWYLDGSPVELKSDGSGVSHTGYLNKKEEWIEVDVRCTWMAFDDGKGLTIEWEKNPVFKTSKMKFTFRKSEYDEEYLDGGQAQMYRYW